MEAIPLTATTTLEVARALEREIFSRYGYPETIQSNCGPQFTSQFFLDLGKTLGIQITNTTGYNPKGNGQVERMHRDLGAIMREVLRHDPKASWEDVLPQALFVLRTAVCRSTGLVPHHYSSAGTAARPSACCSAGLRTTRSTTADDNTTTT